MAEQYGYCDAVDCLGEEKLREECKRLHFMLRHRQSEERTQLATGKSERDAAREIITKAQDILARQLPPEGISADAAIDELLGLLDGPEARAALGDGGANDAI